MKFLTIRQPWASLIAVGAKSIETRPFGTAYRGPLAIHAGKARPTIMSLPGWTDMSRSTAEGPGLTWLDLAGWRVVPMPLGAVVAVCDLVDVVPIVEREWLADGFIGTREDVAAVLPADHPFAPGLHLWFGGQYDGDSSGQLLFGDFTPGRYAWLLDNVRPIDPVPMKGAQGLRDVPDGIAAQIEGAS